MQNRIDLFGLAGDIMIRHYACPECALVRAGGRLTELCYLKCWYLLGNETSWKSIDNFIPAHSSQ